MTLHEAISDYAESVGYQPTEFLELTCDCGSKLFKLYSDDTEGGAVAKCSKCGAKKDILDSERYIEDREQNICNCDAEDLMIAIGLAFHEGTTDPRWAYIGCECPECGLSGVYVDWQER